MPFLNTNPVPDITPTTIGAVTPPAIPPVGTAPTDTISDINLFFCNI